MKMAEVLFALDSGKSSLWSSSNGSLHWLAGGYHWQLTARRSTILFSSAEFFSFFLIIIITIPESVPEKEKTYLPVNFLHLTYRLTPADPDLVPEVLLRTSRSSQEDTSQTKRTDFLNSLCGRDGVAVVHSHPGGGERWADSFLFSSVFACFPLCLGCISLCVTYSVKPTDNSECLVSLVACDLVTNW